jgi:hypothetical protein
LEAAPNCLKLPQYAIRTRGTSAQGKRQNCAELSASVPYYNHADCLVMTRTTRPYTDSQNRRHKFNKCELKLPQSVIIKTTKQRKIIQNLPHALASMKGSYDVQAVRVEFWSQF